jgi:hypothetical protein
MNKWLAGALAAMALAMTPASFAATHSATMEVTFRIQESCAIRTGTTPEGSDAQVSCQHQTPYRIVRNDASAGSASASATAARRSEQPTDADAPAALTVFF